jgi:hypothetical protein
MMALEPRTILQFGYDCLAGQLQNLLANRDLQSLKIHVGHRISRISIS